MRHTQQISLNGKWSFRSIHDKEWMDAEIPSDVRCDLLRNGRIPDPYYDRNNERLQWISDQTWIYRREVEPEGKRNFLLFKGVDYSADFVIDGRKISSHVGAFSHLIFEIPPDSRVLDVILHPPPKSRWEAVKCQMSYGWDFAPRMITVGIWDDVLLIPAGEIFIRDVFIWCEGDGERRDVKIRCEVDSTVEGKFRFDAKIEGVNFPQKVEDSFSFEISRGMNRVDMSLPLEDPRLWMPWDRGDQNLYELTLSADGDTIVENFGVRSIRRERNPGAIKSEPWIFVLNGAREYIRGANWVPPDCMIGGVRRDRYERLLKLVKDANINMLRVWGGGIREKDEFYQICDREGILIWQEFPLACAFFPMRYSRSGDYIQTLISEVKGIVRSIRNHPCIIIWSGGNEVSTLLNRKQLNAAKNACLEEDWTRPYHFVSPRNGDVHDWSVWHTFAPYESYKRNRAPFVSEFGHLSAPCVDSLRKFIPNPWPISESWKYHKYPMVESKVRRYLKPFSPKGLDDYVDAMQRAQAYALQIGIEHFRRRKYRCGGCMFWQFNDPWPAFSWSVVDYYERKKLAYEYVRRSFSPLMICLDYKVRRWDGRFDANVWVVNDLMQRFDGCVARAWLDGTDCKFERILDIEEDCSKMVGRIRWRWHGKIEKPKVRCEIIGNGKVLASNEYDIWYSDIPLPSRLLYYISRLVHLWIFA